MKTIKEIAELAGVHRRTIQNYIHSGKIKAGKVGNQYFIDDSQVNIIKGLYQQRPVQVDANDAEKIAKIDLSKLSERDRLILLRRFVEKKALQEIADEVGITKGGVSFVIKGYLSEV